MKYLDIKLVDNDCVGGEERSMLTFDDIRNIYVKHMNQDKSVDDLDKAIDLIIFYLYLHRTDTIIVNINERNVFSSPANRKRDMTVEQIEKELGYGVNIIS